MSRPQIITTPQGEEMVVLSREEYDLLVDAAENSEDAHVYTDFHRKLKAGEEELVPAEFANRLIDGESPIRVWREYRGLSQKNLAEKASISPPFLSQIEAGKRDGTPETLKKIAHALNVTVDDLME